MNPKKARYQGTVREALDLLRVINHGDERSQEDHKNIIRTAIRYLDSQYQIMHKDRDTPKREIALVRGAYYFGWRYLQYLQEYSEGITDQFAPPPNGTNDTPNFKTISQIAPLINQTKDPHQIWKVLIHYAKAEDLSFKGFKQLTPLVVPAPLGDSLKHLVDKAKSPKQLATLMSKHFSDTLIAIRTQALDNPVRHNNEKLSLALTRYQHHIDLLATRQPPEEQAQFKRKKALSILKDLIAPQLQTWLAEKLRQDRHRGRAPDPAAIAMRADQREALMGFVHSNTPLASANIIDVASSGIKHMKLNDGSRSPSQHSDSSVGFSSPTRSLSPRYRTTDKQRSGDKYNDRPSYQRRNEDNRSRRDRYDRDRRERGRTDERQSSRPKETHLKPVLPEKVPLGPFFRTIDGVQYVQMPHPVYQQVPGPSPAHGYQNLYQQIRQQPQIQPYAQTHQTRPYSPPRFYVPHDQWFGGQRQQQQQHQDSSYRQQTSPNRGYSPTGRTQEDDRAQERRHDSGKDYQRHNDRAQTRDSSRRYNGDSQRRQSTRDQRPRRDYSSDSRGRRQGQDRQHRDSQKIQFDSRPSSPAQQFDSRPATPMTDRSQSRKRTRDESVSSFPRT